MLQDRIRLSQIVRALPAFFQTDVASFLQGIAHFPPHDQDRLIRALLLMVAIHYDQQRSTGIPYVCHPLGVALHVLDQDADVVVAALLHDTIEDGAHKIADSRQEAFEIIEIVFGDRVRTLLSALTNPDFDALLANMAHLSKKKRSVAKNVLYYEHVREAIRDTDVARIKFFDFSENALSLDTLANHSLRIKLQRKYAPVAQLFLDRIEHIVPTHLKETTRARLVHFISENTGNKSLT